MDDKNPIYEYLKSEGLTDLGQDEFVSKYSDRKNLESVYNYLKDNGNTDLEFQPFADKYFPLPKQNEDSAQGLPNTSGTSTEPLQTSPVNIAPQIARANQIASEYGLEGEEYQLEVPEGYGLVQGEVDESGRLLNPYLINESTGERSNIVPTVDNTPVTREQALAQNARIAQEELEQVTPFESVINSVKSTASGLRNVLDGFIMTYGAPISAEDAMYTGWTPEEYRQVQRDVEARAYEHYAEVSKELEQYYTLGIVDSWRDNNLPGVMAGAFNALASMARSAAVTKVSGIPGLYTEMTARLLHDVVKEKSEDEGETIREVLDSDGIDTALGVSRILGIASTVTERMGLRGLSKVPLVKNKVIPSINRFFSNNPNKGAVINYTVDVLGEGGTELFQEGVSEVNKLIAKNPNATAQEIATTFWETMGTDEGMESFFGGVAAKILMSLAGKGVRSGFAKVNNTFAGNAEAEQLGRDYGEITDDAGNVLPGFEPIAERLQNRLGEVLQTQYETENNLTLQQKQRIGDTKARIIGMRETRSELENDPNTTQAQLSLIDSELDSLSQDIQAISSESIDQEAIDSQVLTFRESNPSYEDVNPLSDVPESISTTLERLDNNLSVDTEAVNEASAILYGKYKELQEMKMDERRLMTIQEIDEVMNGLATDIESLESYTNDRSDLTRDSDPVSEEITQTQQQNETQQPSVESTEIPLESSQVAPVGTETQSTQELVTPENRQALQSSYDRLTEGMTEAQIQSDPDLVRMRNRLSTSPQTETSSTPEQSEVVNALSSDQTFLTRLNDSAQRTTRIQELEQRLRDNIIQAGNLGITQDGEQQARQNIEFIRDLTEYAVLRIADGTIKTANALADALSIPRGDVNVQEAFDNAQQINAIVNDATVTPRRQTVKSTIREATQGGTQGRESMTARQALANQMRTLNRGARDMAKNVRELAETVQGYIASQKERFKGVKFNSTELRSIARQVSGIVNEARLEKALNVVDRALENAEFRAKLSGITSLQNRAKRMARSKRFPQRVGTEIREFANINPRNLDDVAQIEQYHGMLENLTKMGVRPSEISITAMRQIVDVANTNEELSRQERAERREQDLNDPEWQAKQIEKKTKELKRLGFDDAQITDLLDPTKPFDEVMQSLEEAMSAMKQTRKDVIRNTANELLTSIKGNIDNIYNQMSPSDARNLREFLGSLNIDLIQDNQLLGLNYVLNNILNNSDIQGLGRFKAMATAFDKVADTGLRQRALGNLRKIGEQADSLRKKFFATLDIRREAIFKDTRLAGIVDNFFGFQSYDSGMLRVKRELKSLQGGIDAIIRKHTKGNKDYWQDSYENAMAGVYTIVAQYRQSWTPEQIQKNYVGRIKAVIESLDRLRNEAALTGRTTYDPTIKVLERVVSNIANFTRDSEGNIETLEPKMTLDQMWNELGEGHKEYYNYTRDWFEANKEEFFSVTRMFSNEAIENDWVNYFPMSYSDYTKTETYGSGARADVDLTEVINGFHLRSTTNNLSGAGTVRTIEGEMLPRNKVFNFDLLGNFEREAGKMLADVHTLEDKWVVNNMTDIRNNGLIGDVNQPAGFEVQTALTYRQLVAERIEADQNFLNRGGRPQDRSTIAIWTRVMGTTGVIRALGGYAQWVKQSTPILEVSARIKNQKSLLLAMQIRAGFNTGDLDVSNIMSRANVQLRADQESLFNLPNKTRSINAEVEKSLRGLAKDLGIKYEDFLTNSKLGKFSLSPLIESDKYYAEIGWLALYIDNATDGGNKKLDLSEVNENAVSYANSTNNVVMNTSEMSNQGAYAESWLRLFQPMLGFSINSGHGLIIAGSKLRDAVRNGDNVGIKRYSAEVLGNFANVVAFGAMSWGVRTAGILGGKAIVELLIKGTEDDEEREKELLEQVDKIYGKRLLLNDARSINYIATDLIIRGAFSDAVTPLMGALNESLGVQQFLFGEEELREAGYTYKPFSSTNPNPYINALETYAPVMGVQGMGLTATLGAATNIADVFQTHKDFVRRTRGFSDFEGKNILVDYADLTPEGIDKFGMPKYMQYSNYLNGVMAMSTIFGLSDQTASSMVRNSKAAIKQIVREDRGLVRTGEWERRLMNARKSFNDIEIEGVKLDLTADEQRKYSEMYLKESVREGKKHSNIKGRVTPEEWHDGVSENARDKVIVQIIKDYEDVFLDKIKVEARIEQEEDRWRQRSIELNKKAKQKK